MTPIADPLENYQQFFPENGVVADGYGVNKSDDQPTNIVVCSFVYTFPSSTLR